MSINFYQISISLFSNCNLNCQFCFQKHNTTIKDFDLKQLLKKSQYIINQLKKYNITNLSISFWGGELFQDKFSNDIFQYYIKIKQQFINKILLQLPIIKIKTNYISNGIFKNYKRVENLLIKTNSSITFSYDPIGRFKTQQEQDTLFFNIQYFRKYNSSVLITLSKPAIQSYISGENRLFNLNDVKINTTYYYANTNYEKYIPDDLDLYNFFKYCIDNNKTNIHIIQTLKNIKDVNYNFPSCQQTILYKDGEWIHNCVKRFTHLSLQKYFGEYEKNLTQQNSINIKNIIGISKRNCLICKYYNKCVKNHLMCLGMSIFQGYKINKKFCPISSILQYIQRLNQ